MMIILALLINMTVAKVILRGFENEIFSLRSTVQQKQKMPSYESRATKSQSKDLQVLVAEQPSKDLQQLPSQLFHSWRQEGRPVPSEEARPKLSGNHRGRRGKSVAGKVQHCCWQSSEKTSQGQKIEQSDWFREQLHIQMYVSQWKMFLHIFYIQML